MPGGKAAFFSSYDQSWGSFKSITYPTPGNHEYKRRKNSTGTDCGGVATARGYFDYFTCTGPPVTPCTSAPAPANGITEIIVGTGGEGDERITATPAANSVVRSTKLNGILSLTLRPSGFDWRYVNVPGQTFQDSGSADCH